MKKKFFCGSPKNLQFLYPESLLALYKESIMAIGEVHHGLMNLTEP